MLDLETLEPAVTAAEQAIPLDRSSVVVRAPLDQVLFALAPFARQLPVDVTGPLARGQGLDDLFPAAITAMGRRAVVGEAAAR